MLTLETLEFLTSLRGETLLAELAYADLNPMQTLPLLSRLRKENTPDEAGAVLELARLRIRAMDKFGADAACMFFTADALEQASDRRIRAWRAKMAAEEGYRRVYDMGCGIGADTLAFATALSDCENRHIEGVDIDPVRVACARLNAAALDLDAHFTHADMREVVPQNPGLIFFDPGRRGDDGKRIFHPEAYQPPLSTLRRWNAPALWAKIAPGVDHYDLKGYGGTLDFCSVEGALKEAFLRTGNEGILEGGLPRRRAVLFHGETVETWSDDPAPVTIAPPRGWLIEPDPALLRAELVSNAAVAWQGTQLDDTIAYITADDPPQTHWARAWRIRDWMPFNIKRLRAYLRQHNSGEITVKKRGVPMTPESVIGMLKAKGDGACTLVLTRYDGGIIVMICDAQPIVTG